MKQAFLVAATLAALTAPAFADDSSAMLGAGGIVLTNNADIRMASEDLTLSPKAVKVRYTFVNDGPKDIDTIVAFPLPDVDNYEYSEAPVGTTVDSVPNFVGFKLSIDGKPVAPQVEVRAVQNGRDVTQAVVAAGAPLLVAIGGYDKMRKLSKAQRAMLVKAGLVEADDTELHPKWTTTTKYWWKMHFPAGKTVTVDHSYQPVTGQTFFTSYALSQKEEYDGYVKDFCIDPPTRNAIAAGLAAIKRKSGNDGMFNQYTTEFVIVTANNWKGPIGRFHLTVDKLKPDNVLSMCWAGDLKKTAATRFESTLTGFAPKADIKILVLERPTGAQN
jgi:hypothetical protein